MVQCNTYILPNCVFFHLFQPVLLLKHDALKLGKVSQLQKFLEGCPKLNCITIVNVTNHMIQNMIHKIPSF
jgi:hypothetical protein